MFQKRNDICYLKGKLNNGIEELKKELEETAQKIKDNQFEPDCEDCEGCPFRKICKK